MSWLYQPPRPVPTKHNGIMRLSRLFGVWTLWGHDGTYQGAPYMDGVWKKTLRHLRRQKNLQVRRCLILGVAMGSTFNLIQKNWPEAEIVGIDWEPALFEIGKILGVFHANSKVTFREGDAKDETEKLEGTFDLIIVDLFNGRKVADAVSTAELQEAVKSHLAENGIVALNCYNQRPVLEDWHASLGEPRFIRYSANDVAIFTKPDITAPTHV